MNEAQDEGGLLDQLTRILGGTAVGSLRAPTSDRRALILRLARDVAHAGERQETPLATYLIGRYVELRRAAGLSEDQALAEAAEAVSAVTGSLDTEVQ
jgi:hypothetical protein